MGYYINVEPDVSVYVEDLNPKGRETFVFLHGWPGSHELFEYQFNQLAMNNYRCIGLDQRGFGKSDRPLNGYDYDRLSDDVRIVMNQLDLRDVTLVGHSTGGAIAIRYMARHKGFGVSKLVLCAAAAPSLVQRPYFPYGQTKETVLEIINNTLNDRPKMLRGFSDIFFFQNVSDPLKDWFFKLGLEAAGWSTAAIANTWLDEEQLFFDMKEINVPTLILHGIHDAVCFFPLAEAQNKGIRNSKLIPFNNSGHALFYEERDKFNQALMQFIDEKI
ncbi:alpha/beta hydrolase [Anaerocolumna aminovalerica]|uniref:Non-heme chloroperoxidase n=1 Tax=Anaerocolumna aminovalerica TaxID=1527 RepID=A0A1I5J8S8_9FIRM|nr:alpha/beta hydrolase [Anaerocolumna aminovalerica]MBU5331054.1 alpha/beta hydrolase [Anaerocolumna aminovalerica]SFO69069.1 non-heme chloroperoxidase [Anaerocolumna aminovalerica]